MKYTPQDIGKLVRETRKGLGVTQKALALTSGTGLRFIIELERGKETAEIGKVLDEFKAKFLAERTAAKKAVVSA